MRRVRGFYAVLDRDDERLARALVGPGGARVLQVRLEAAGDDVIVRVARMARRVCDEHGAALIVNDRLDLALAVGADGVHLGQADLPLAEARVRAGARLWIGISTHNVAQVERAIAGGADYLGFGPIFPTRTKTHPDPTQGIEGLRAAVRAARGASASGEHVPASREHVPIVAIGGITPATAGALYAAGADAICAIGAVTGAADVIAAARALGRSSPWLRNARGYMAVRRR